MTDAAKHEPETLIEGTLSNYRNINTKLSYKKKMTAFLSWLDENDRPLSSINMQDVTDFIESLGERTASTKHAYFSAIKALVKHLSKKQIIDSNFLDGTSADMIYGTKSDYNKNGAKPMPAEQVRAFFNAAADKEWKETRDLAMYGLMYSALLTVSEVQSLDLEDFYSYTGELLVAKGTSKHRRIILDPDMLRVMDRHIAENELRGETGKLFRATKMGTTTDRISDRSIRRNMKTRQEDAGFEDAEFSTLSLRLSGVFARVQDGASAKDIQAMIKLASKKAAQKLIAQSGVSIDQNANNLFRLRELFEPAKNKGQAKPSPAPEARSADVGQTPLRPIKPVAQHSKTTPQRPPSKWGKARNLLAEGRTPS